MTMISPRKTTGLERKTPRVYLSSKVRIDAIEGNNRIGELLKSGEVFEIFLPHTISPPQHHEKIDEAVYKKCVDEINNARILLLLADSYGIDCAWEVGYARGIEKYIVAIVETLNGLKRICEDWMVKGAVDAILLTKIDLYEAASKDAMLKGKRLFFVKYCDIPRVLSAIAKRDLI